MHKSICRILAAVVTLGFSGQLLAQEPVTEITLTTDKTMFLYDVKAFTVKAGTKVKITLTVPPDAVPQPHNLVLIKPGKEAVVTQAAMMMMADPQGLTKGYIPENDAIVAHTKLLNPGQTDTIEVAVPAEAGAYAYICTFPGHFTIMKGVMTVVP